MNIYEIDHAIMDLFDPETGECLDEEKLADLQMAHDKKLENMGCWVKDLDAEAAAIRTEEKSLADRRRVIENKAERLRAFLGRYIGEGNRFQSARCAISWRKSESVKVDIELLKQDPLSDNYLRFKDPDVNRAEIKKAIKDGTPVMGAEIVINQNMQIK